MYSTSASAVVSVSRQCIEYIEFREKGKRTIDGWTEHIDKNEFLLFARSLWTVTISIEEWSSYHLTKLHLTYNTKCGICFLSIVSADYAWCIDNSIGRRVVNFERLISWMVVCSDSNSDVQRIGCHLHIKGLIKINREICRDMLIVFLVTGGLIAGRFGILACFLFLYAFQYGCNNRKLCREVTCYLVLPILNRAQSRG
jgi:hypothetical protein